MLHFDEFEEELENKITAICDVCEDTADYFYDGQCLCEQCALQVFVDINGLFEDESGLFSKDDLDPETIEHFQMFLEECSINMEEEKNRMIEEEM